MSANDTRDQSVVSLFDRLAAGDCAAAGSFCAEFGPALSRAVTRRLRSLRLQASVDPEDIAQQVLIEVFQNGARRLHLTTRPAVFALLRSMAEHRLTDEARRAYARKRGSRPLHDTDSHRTGTINSREPEPVEELIRQESLRTLHDSMSPDEWALASDWSSGLDWRKLAQIHGGSPDAVRKKLRRLFERTRVRLKVIFPPPR
jgi:DNA-directed RNA polymerase specialized sigma24 family protein